MNELDKIFAEAEPEKYKTLCQKCIYEDDCATIGCIECPNFEKKKRDVWNYGIRTKRNEKRRIK